MPCMPPLMSSQEPAVEWTSHQAPPPSPGFMAPWCVAAGIALKGHDSYGCLEYTEPADRDDIVVDL